MSHRFDATLKELFTPAPEDFAQVFGLPLVRPAQTLNVDLSTISAATDVALGFGAPLQEIVDLVRPCSPLNAEWRQYNKYYKPNLMSE